MLLKKGLLLLLLFSFIACIENAPKTENKLVTNEIKVQNWIQKLRKSDEISDTDKHVLLQKALDSLKDKPDNFEKAHILNDISLSYLNLKDSINFIKTNSELQQLSKKLGYKKFLGLAHWDLGFFYQNIKADSAYHHFKKAYTAFTSSTLKEDEIQYPAKMLLNMSIVLQEMKDYAGAEVHAIRAIEELNIVERPKFLFIAYNTLAVIQNGMQKFDKSLEYHYRAKEMIDLAPEEKQAEFAAINANNIAHIYLRKKEYATAFELFNDLESNIQLKTIRPGLYAKVLGSKAYSGFKTNALEIKEVEELLEKSNILLDSLDDRYNLARNHEFQAEILAAKKDTLKAITYATLAKSIAEETANNDRVLSSLKLLTTLDGKNSRAYADAYFNLNEDLHQQERLVQDKFARIRMETDEILVQNEILTRQRIILAIITLGLLVFGIAVFIIVNQRVLNQKLRFGQKQQESNQEIYNLMLSQYGKMEEGKKLEQKRVSEELHDGILGQMLGIRLVLSGLNERNDEASMQQRAELIEKLRDLEEEIRTISHELNQSAYEKVHNFIIAIEELVKTIDATSDINVNFTYDKNINWDHLQGDLKINSYRIIQECIQNSIKHAQCKYINIRFEYHNKLLNLSVADDGVGFDTTKGKRGIGIKNIVSRVKKLNGTLEINSIINKGTTITVAIPIIFDSINDPNSKVSRKIAQEA
ncbi:MAG: hypothetical protein HKP38_12505 [Croceitalea sp.]|nr:hypothetical protein [Croceitalea sp.]